MRNVIYWSASTFRSMAAALLVLSFGCSVPAARAGDPDSLKTMRTDAHPTVDMNNLESRLRYGGSASATDHFPNSPYGIIVPSASESLGQGSQTMIASGPVPVFAFKDASPDRQTAPTAPVIERLWAGLGGHRLASQTAFPVICRIKAGSRPFKGTLRVTDTRLSWSTAVALDAGQEANVQVDAEAIEPASDSGSGAETASASGTTAGAGNNSGSADSSLFYRLDLVGQDGVGSVAERSFSMDEEGAGTYWVTPSVDGADTADSVIALAMPPRGSKITPAAGSPVQRLEAIAPSLLPENAAAWGPASAVIVGRGAENLLPPAGRAALLAWAAGGGRLVVFPGSNLLPLSSSSPITNQISPSGRHSVGVPWGKGLIIEAPEGIRCTDQSLVGQKEFVDWALTKPDWPVISASDVLSSIHANEPTVAMPHWPVILGLGLLYVGILGPVSLGMMRRVRRITQVWLVVPGMALGLTVVILGLSLTWTHALQTLNIATVAFLPQGSHDASVRSDLYFFTPTPGSFTLDTGAQVLTDLTSPSTGTDPTGEDRREGANHSLRLDELQSYSERRCTLSGSFHIEGTMDVRINSDGAGLVRNGTDRSLPASGLFTQGFRQPIPALQPGEIHRFGRNDWQPVASAERANPGSSSEAVTPAGADSLGQADYIPNSSSAAWWVIPGSWVDVTSEGTAGGIHQRLLCVTALAPPILRPAHTDAMGNGKQAAAPAGGH